MLPFRTARDKTVADPKELYLRHDTIDCRELVGMAIAKRATGRNWRQVRDDLLFYLRGRGTVPQIVGDAEEYQFVFPGGRIFYHRATGEYGYDGPIGKGV